MPYYHPQGSLVFAQDPTGAHTNPRLVIVVSDVDRPYVEGSDGRVSQYIERLLARCEAAPARVY